MSPDTGDNPARAAPPTAAEPVRRIRVLLMLPSLHGGGAERVAVQLYERIDPARFDVRMGLLRDAGPYVLGDRSRLELAQIGRRFLDFDRGNKETYRPQRLAPAIVLTPLNVLAILRRFRPHVVISFLKGTSVIVLAAVTIYGRSRVRFIAREGNNTLAVIDDELESPLARAIVRRIHAYVFGAADRLLTICHEMAGDLTRALALDPARVRTIHNAVDVAEVERRAREPLAPELALGSAYVIGVGRLEKQKAWDVLLRAFAASSRAAAHRLVIVGEGSQRDGLLALARELGLATRVQILGWQDNPWALMHRAALFVLPSRWEGFGNVVIEAMASGVPVVVSDCSYGPKEIVRDGRDGLVVPAGDVAATRAAIERVLGDPALRERFVAAGRERAREFDLPGMVRRYERLFEEVAAELPGRG